MTGESSSSDFAKGTGTVQPSPGLDPVLNVCYETLDFVFQT